MTILTKPNSISKGTPAQFSISKLELAQHPLVSADAYYSVQSNWKAISLLYVNPEGQMKDVKFNATVASPVANFLASSTARDIFEIHSVRIIDFDGGVFSIPRSELTPSEWDVDMTPPPSALFDRDYSNPASPEAFESFLNSSVTGNVLFFDTPSGAEYTANPPATEFVEGVQYTFRMYVAADSGVPLSVSFQLGESPAEAHSFSGGQIIPALGSYIDYVFTATASQATTNPFLRIIKNGTGSTLSIPRIEIFPS